MKVFIVFAHPEPLSFNGKMFQLAKDCLQEQGHEIQVSDLYQMKFNPIAGGHDFFKPPNAEQFFIQEEQEKASNNGTFASDIIKEQNKLYWCDLVIFQFPFWWFGIPAILKGWFDRVFAYGWAYGRNERFDSGRLKGRRALLSITTGSPKERFSDGKLFAPIEHILYPITIGTLQYVGFQVLEPYIAWGLSRAHDSLRDAYFEEYHLKLTQVESQVCLPDHTIREFPDPTDSTFEHPTNILKGLMKNREISE